MLSSSLFLLTTLPFVLCAPIQQWAVDTKQHVNQVSLMLHDDIQAYYENIADEVISTHSEDVLVQLAQAMNDQTTLETFLQPQAIALLHHPVQETCLMRMPGMIAQQLHRLHTKVLDAMEPTLDKLLQEYPIQDDMMQLTLLNAAMGEHVTQLFDRLQLEHKVALDLSACEIQQNQQQQKPRPPPSSFWLLLKSVWKKATLTSSPPAGRMMAELDNNPMDQHITVVEDHHHHHDASLFVPGPSLLRSHLDHLVTALLFEFEDRLLDLETTLRSDVFDEQVL
ncbi:uncharacterized protein BX664DRAFT_314246 [Halteromyces radiatus]|uniref:uncharacterized protein n=1 Tax=Halteromyces radiatus TaxID=101107 RepID=UPI0022204257|nr:uncharacterized protein BX664DRAFT_314246 [Halteromyces radiatus]KAI8088999.1 hypothetical protein BX664DRAFT_314246 [Halteromyces radiatus]